jgi:hypothetical protein
MLSLLLCLASLIIQRAPVSCCRRVCAITFTLPLFGLSSGYRVASACHGQGHFVSSLVVAMTLREMHSCLSPVPSYFL